MAKNPQAQDHRSLAVDEHHRAGSRVRARRAAATLSRGCAGGLRVDRRAHPQGALPAGAAVSADDRRIHLGIAVRSGRSRRGSGRKLPPRASGGDRLCHRVDSPAGERLALHRAAQQSHSLVLRGDWRACRRARTRHDRRTGHGPATRAHDPRRRIRVATPHRHADAGASARLPRTAGQDSRGAEHGQPPSQHAPEGRALRRGVPRVRPSTVVPTAEQAVEDRPQRDTGPRARHPRHHIGD